MSYSQSVEKTVKKIRNLFRMSPDSPLDEVIQAFEVTRLLSAATSNEQDEFARDCLSALKELKSK